MSGAATYPDGYSVHYPAWSCPYVECDFASDVWDDMLEHEEVHPDLCSQCGGDHDRIDRREGCP